MKKLKIILPIALLFLTFSCENEDKYEKSKYFEGDTSNENNSELSLSSTAAIHQDDEREFIRTADLSMEVENVYKSTMSIEKKLSEIGGFVTKSDLNSRIISKEIFPISIDSAKEAKKYTVNNTMTIRVPQLELGNFLLSLSDEIKFLNYRSISAEDVSFNFIAAELEEERLNKTSEKLDKINNESGKITDKQDIVNNIDEKQSKINHNKISTMKMKNDVAYSSVTLLLNEKEKIAETVIVNPKSYDQKYRTSFGYRVGNSIQSGFYFFQTLLVGLLYLWPLWIFLGFAILGIKWYRKSPRIT